MHFVLTQKVAEKIPEKKIMKKDVKLAKEEIEIAEMFDREIDEEIPLLEVIQPMTETPKLSPFNLPKRVRPKTTDFFRCAVKRLTISFFLCLFEVT